MTLVSDLMNAIDDSPMMSRLINQSPNDYDKPPVCFVEFGGFIQVGQSLRSIAHITVYSCALDDQETEIQLEKDALLVANELRVKTGHVYNNSKVIDVKYDGWEACMLTFISCEQMGP